MKALILISFVFLAACDKLNSDAPAIEKFHHSILSFGTVIDITIIGTNSTLAQQAFTIHSPQYSCNMRAKCSGLG